MDSRGIRGDSDAKGWTSKWDSRIGLQRLNPPYLKQLPDRAPLGRPEAMLSLDGRMASEAASQRGLGGEAEQRLAHRLRAESDAVLVGIGTVLADDPLLTVRLARGRTPIRVVLDSTLRTPRQSRILATTDESPVVFATTSRGKARIRELEVRGASVCVFEPEADGRVPLVPVLRRLAGDGRFAVLVEGGTAVHTSFLRAGLVDRIAVGIAPVILGGATVSSLAGDLGRSRLSEAIALEGLEIRRVGRDLWIEGRIDRNGASHV